ncbi:MAG: hypothetical protein EOM14_16005, partial [Clostridia bacterium]|nr:hypothetical protein [Clostridia bacterium]
MTRRVRCITRLIIAVLLLTLLDAVFSVIGIRLGFIGEANPILRDLMQQHPEPAALAALVYT